MIHFHMQRFKFIDFMVIELRWFKKKKKKNKKMENMDEMWKSLFQILCTSYITTQPFLLVIFHTFFPMISLKVKSTSNWKWKWTKSLYSVFNGVDHSNPYIHSTTVLCDTYIYTALLDYPSREIETPSPLWPSVPGVCSVDCWCEVAVGGWGFDGVGTSGAVDCGLTVVKHSQHTDVYFM